MLLRVKRTTTTMETSPSTICRDHYYVDPAPDADRFRRELLNLERLRDAGLEDSLLLILKTLFHHGGLDPEQTLELEEELRLSVTMVQSQTSNLARTNVLQGVAFNDTYMKGCTMSTQQRIWLARAELAHRLPTPLPRLLPQPPSTSPMGRLWARERQVRRRLCSDLQWADFLRR